MQKRPERAVDQRRRLLELEIAHVALAEVELHTSLGRIDAGLREHCRRRVDPHHAPSGLASNGDRDTAVPDRELDDKPTGLTGQLDVERHIRRHMRRPLLVANRECLGPAHEPMLGHHRLATARH